MKTASEIRLETIDRTAKYLMEEMRKCNITLFTYGLQHIRDEVSIIKALESNNGTRE